MTDINEKRRAELARKRLLVTLNQVTARGLGRALFAFFFLMLCQTFVVSLLMSPLYAGVLRAGTGDGVLILASVLVYAAYVVWALFQYGFFALILRMVRGEYVTLGFIFYGYKKLRASLAPALFVALVLTVLSALFAAALFLLTDLPGMIAAAMQSDGASPLSDFLRFDPKILAVCAGGLLAAGILFALLAFCFLAAYDRGDGSFASALRANFRLLRGRRILLLRLLFAAGGRFLLVALGAVVLQSLASLAIPAGSLSVARLVLNFVYLINFYTALLRMYFVLPVLYEDARAPKVNVLIEDRSDSAVIDETIALLEHGSDSDEGV